MSNAGAHSPFTLTCVHAPVYIAATALRKSSGMPSVCMASCRNCRLTRSNALELSRNAITPPLSGASLLRYLTVSTTRSTFSEMSRNFKNPICDSCITSGSWGMRCITMATAITRLRVVVTETGRYWCGSSLLALGLFLNTGVRMAVASVLST